MQQLKFFALLTSVTFIAIFGFGFHADARKQQSSENPLTTLAKQNGKIAFTSVRDGNAEVYVMNADGSNQIRLTNNTAFDGDPAWSPDGLKIAFTSTRDGNEQIYVMNFDGTNQTRLTSNSFADRTPVWSPDGVQIAFASNRDSGNFDIFTMNANGTVQTNLSKGILSDFQEPDWSPDGTKIACSQAIVTNGTVGTYGVVVMTADGKNQVRLSAPGNLDISPRWSPDNARIVFSSMRPGIFATFEIFVMTATGANQTRITNSTDEKRKPGWSPDGTKITFQTNRRFNFDVFTMNADGSNQVQLTTNLFDDTSPVWQSVSVPAANPIDDPQLFVRRHYLDFLNREPDPGGLSYWVSQITQCGTDQACINRRRVDVSAAFFIEQEFQQTGFFVERFYQASFCRRPTFAEFTIDRNRLVVGTDLEANKQAFAQDFVQRVEFLQKYLPSLSPSGFVDALIQTVQGCVGVDLTSQRAALISEYNSSTDQTISRARTLRLVVDNTEFRLAEFNKGFVVTEYFGYLRRDPDQGGLDFWLDVLNNQVPGNFKSMVCAFLTSPEYQKRFSSIVTHSDSECAGL